MQKILTAEQFRQLDAYTIRYEPIASIDLMERAAEACVRLLLEHFATNAPYLVVCGTGNNGGDGLAIARMLSKQNANVQVHITGNPEKGSEDFIINLERLQSLNVSVESSLASCELTNVVIVEALFGNGLSRPAGGDYANTIAVINDSGSTVVSIDLPGGLQSDPVTFDVYNPENAVVRADYTYTFHCYKESLLLDDLEVYFGLVHLLDIGLDHQYSSSMPTQQWSVELTDGKLLLKDRRITGHKGIFGHALLVSGQKNMMGASILAATACLRSGVGLLTVHCPASGQLALQTALPEAMTKPSKRNDHVDPSQLDISKYSAIGVGCGIGRDANMETSLMEFLATSLPSGKPHVIDADALNILAGSNELDETIRNSSAVLTPHPKEFDRLFGDHPNRYAQIRTARQKAQELGVHILLKGACSVLLTADGKSYYFPFPNPGMAKGGSGDVLTGLLLSLLAQGYPPAEAVIVGMCAQATAGYAMRDKYGERVMLPGDVAGALSGFFA